MFDFTHPWFQPLGRRLATAVTCCLWFAMEAWMQSPFWMVLAGATTALVIWKLIVTYDAKP